MDVEEEDLSNSDDEVCDREVPDNDSDWSSEREIDAEFFNEEEIDSEDNDDDENMNNSTRGNIR